jgi:hypothetical protein
VAAARELFAAGCQTPGGMRAASWQERADALGRGHYRRYDERTATMLGDGAALLDRRWGGDLRRLRDTEDGDAGRIAAALTEFPGIGPAGAGIFLREVQPVWPSVAPFIDQRVLTGAAKVGLPASAEEIATLAASPAELARLAAALVRVAARGQAASEVIKVASTDVPGS